jgi:hypothetical protein
MNPGNLPVFETPVVARPLVPAVFALNAAWWTEIDTFTHRDQLGLVAAFRETWGGFDRVFACPLRFKPHENAAPDGTVARQGHARQGQRSSSRASAVSAADADADTSPDSNPAEPGRLDRRRQPLAVIAPHHSNS